MILAAVDASFPIKEIHIKVITTEPTRNFTEKSRVIMYIYLLLKLLVPSIHQFHLRCSFLSMQHPDCDTDKPIHLFLDINNHYEYLRQEPFCRCRLCHYCRNQQNLNFWPYNLSSRQLNRTRFEAIDNMVNNYLGTIMNNFFNSF